MECKADTCTRKPVAKGLCTTHYQRLRRNGDLEIRGYPVITVVDGKKMCTLCKETLEVSKFPIDKRMSSGYGSQCKPCKQIYERGRRHGLSSEEMKTLIEIADGKCMMCHTVTDRLNVDHDHSCCPNLYQNCGNCVRGLICFTCNNALSYLERNHLVELGTNYLISHREMPLALRLGRR